MSEATMTNYHDRRVEAGETFHFMTISGGRDLTVHEYCGQARGRWYCVPCVQHVPRGHYREHVYKKPLAGTIYSAEIWEDLRRAAQRHEVQEAIEREMGDDLVCSEDPRENRPFGDALTFEENQVAEDIAAGEGPDEERRDETGEADS